MSGILGSRTFNPPPATTAADTTIPIMIFVFLFIFVFSQFNVR